MMFEIILLSAIIADLVGNGWLYNVHVSCYPVRARMREAGVE